MEHAVVSVHFGHPNLVGRKLLTLRDPAGNVEGAIEIGRAKAFAYTSFHEEFPDDWEVFVRTLLRAP